MSPQKAVEVFLRSVDECFGITLAPELYAEDVAVCQGAARNRTLEAANGP